MQKILMRSEGVEGSAKLSWYLEHEGYSALKKAVDTLAPDQVVEMVKESGLRGRGGAGFPAGVKWGFLPKDYKGQRYLCCNCDEGEPGTFKDRFIIENEPHMLLEGIALASYATKDTEAYIFIRGEYLNGLKMLEAAIEEAEKAGYLGENILGKGFNLKVRVHRSAGSYVCGEETVLLEALEGRRPMPRLKPPFPAAEGLWGKPTVVNNVETLSNVPGIVINGAEWYKSLGKSGGAGTKIFCVSGRLKKPGLYELPVGTTLREIIFDHAGGMADGYGFKAVFPGGTSTALLTEQHLDVPAEFESLQEAGSAMGTGALVVVDDKSCIIEVLKRISEFYRDESCGKCAPCREGIPWLVKILESFERFEACEDDIELLGDICSRLVALTFCPLGECPGGPIASALVHFRDEFEDHVAGRCGVKGSS